MALTDRPGQREEGGAAPIAADLSTLLAQALDTKDGRTALRIGESYERSGELQAARQAFEAATRLREPRAWRELGRSLERSGDRDAANVAYEHGAAAGDVIALRMLAQSLARDGKLDDAAHMFQEAIRQGDLVSRRMLASLEADRGRHETAVALWLEAADSGDHLSRRLLGQYLAKQGDLDAAVDQLERAAELGDTIALRTLGEVHFNHGRVEDAFSALRAAESRGDRTAGRLLQRLERWGGAALAPAPELDAGDRAEAADAESTRNGANADATPASTVAARVVSDLPSEIDLLGVAPLVNGLTLLLRDCRTELPITIAITGPWGGGKSSVMRQLRAALEASPEPAPRRPAADARQERDADARRWRTVQFDAWKYERRERLWAALATSIYEQPQKTMRWRERLRFRIRLEWRRRGPLGFLRSFAWPVPIAAAGTAAAIVTGFGIVSLAGLAPLLVTAVQFSGTVTDPFKRAMQRSSRTPDYEGALGFTQQTEHDVACLLRTLTDASATGVAIFVDDLDRCSSRHVVEVVETMNQIFNSDDERPCLFVLGMDRQVVAAAIEVEYEPTVRRLEDARSPLAGGFGMSFLSKLVQLSVAVPSPRRDAMRRLLTHIVKPDDVDRPEPAPDVAAVPEPDGAAYAPESLEEVSELGDELRSDGTYAPAEVENLERELRSSLIRRDSHDVVAAERAAVAWLEPNPRQLKRFDNAFRLQLYVASEAGDLRFSAEELVALARWVAIRLRWPQLAEDLDDAPALLGALDAHANDAGESADEELTRRYGHWFEDRALRAALAETIVDRRVSCLPLDAFLHVA